MQSGLRCQLGAVSNVAKQIQLDKSNMADLLRETFYKNRHLTWPSAHCIHLLILWFDLREHHGIQRRRNCYRWRRYVWEDFGIERLSQQLLSIVLRTNCLWTSHLYYEYQRQGNWIEYLGYRCPRGLRGVPTVAVSESVGIHRHVLGGPTRIARKRLPEMGARSEAIPTEGDYFGRNEKRSSSQPVGNRSALGRRSGADKQDGGGKNGGENKRVFFYGVLGADEERYKGHFQDGCPRRAGGETKRSFKMAGKELGDSFTLNGNWKDLPIPINSKRNPLFVENEDSECFRSHFQSPQCYFKHWEQYDYLYILVK